MTDSLELDRRTVPVDAWAAKRVINRLRRLAKMARQPRLDRPDRTLIVTGIPRSGTSLFCALASRIEGMVCFNEIFYDVGTLPYDIRKVRERLHTGRAVPNKYDGTGQLATDTMSGAEVRYVTLPKQRPDVVVGTNVNVPYLFRMRQLLKLGCPIIALVRDPVYAIASWGSARASSIPEAHVGPAHEDVHPRWRNIRFTGRTAVERRAELWNLLAGIIDEHRRAIDILRYEDLVANPARELQKLAQKFNLEPPDSVAQLSARNDDSRFHGLAEIRLAVAMFAPLRASFGY